MSSNTKKLHNDFDTVPSEDKLLVRNSQEVMFDSFKDEFKLTCAFTGLSVGDICSVEIPGLYEQVNKVT